MNADFITPGVEIDNLILEGDTDYTYDGRATVYWSLSGDIKRWGVERLNVLVDRVDLSGYLSGIEDDTETLLDKTYESGWDDYDMYVDFDEGFEFPLRPVSVIVDEPQREITVRF